MNPTVSIILATYNSSHLLKYSIGSVLNNDFSDWELIVVGDHCTDDTEQVVKNFNDPRIRFFNLDKNSGQQAVPNNFGISKARGTLLAFLNQDDLYMKDHLSRCVKILSSVDWDIVCVPHIAINPASPEELKSGKYKVRVLGTPIKDKYSPFQEYIASSWFMRKKIFDQVGLWSSEANLYVTPSQEWMFRASQKGASIKYPEYPTVIIIWSGVRKNFYRRNDSPEHEYWYARIKVNDVREELLAKALNQYVSLYLDYRYNKLLHGFWKTLVRPIRWLLWKRGIHPRAFERRIFYGRGGFIREYRKIVGLDEK